MNERVGLTIITRDEAKALHGVEKFHGAAGLFAGQLTLWRRFALCHSDHIADDHEIASRHLAATIHQGEFQTLAFSQTFKTGTFDRADVNKHIFPAVFTLDEAKTFLNVEELYNALPLTDDLSRQTTAGATGRAARATTEATAARGATEAATITAAEAAAITAAEAATTTAAAAETITTAKTVATATSKWVKAFFAEPVALVSAPAATPSIKTHKPERTFASPLTDSRGGVDDSRQAEGKAITHHAQLFTLHFST